MTPAHHKRHARITINGQIDNHGGAGHSARGAARLHRGYRPVRVTPLRWQDTLGCPHLPGTLSPNQLGRGFGSGPFPVSRNPTVGVSSPLTRAGRGLSADPLRRALPAFQFKTTNYLARQSTNRSPATAHSLCLLRCNNHAAKGVVNVQEPVGGFRIV